MLNPKISLCKKIDKYDVCVQSTTASVAGTDVVCIIGTAVLIFGQCKHKISTALSLLNLITLFCRDFE